MNLKAGSQLQGGRYRIEKVLGQGGFGITYLGVQTSLDDKVAIKEFFMKELVEKHGPLDEEAAVVCIRQLANAFFIVL